MYELLNKLASYLWGPPMMTLILFTGLYFSYKTGFFQIRKFGFIFRKTLLTIFKKQKKNEFAEGVMTPLQAISTALAGTVGNGNIAGVAAAIAIGGPGAVFWMWLIALIGMMTKMVEVTLAVHFRSKDEDGNFYGGPMYYIEKGLGKKWKPLATFFSFSMVIAALGTAVYAQPNTMGVALKTVYNVPPIVTAAGAVLITGLVIIGGFKRIGIFCEKLVPTMCIIYILGAIGIIITHIGNLPGAFVMIFKYAFAPAPAMGGFVGAGIMLAMRRGMSRGMFSNEAGMGSAPMVHATAITDSAVGQGLWGVMEVFIDTIIVCSLTALAILSSGVWNSGKTGAELTFSAFETTYGSIGPAVVTIAVVLFALSTMIGYTIEFETSVNYLWGKKAVKVFKWLYLIPPFIAAGKSVESVWLVVDIAAGIVAIPNLIAMLLLSGVFVKLFKEYIAKEELGIGSLKKGVKSQDL
jgi:AGCS family alanine or glycine:cation symporter